MFRSLAISDPNAWRLWVVSYRQAHLQAPALVSNISAFEDVNFCFKMLPRRALPPPPSPTQWHSLDAEFHECQRAYSKFITVRGYKGGCPFCMYPPGDNRFSFVSHKRLQRGLYALDRPTCTSREVTVFLVNGLTLF
jgi:hypothetical protein